MKTHEITSIRTKKEKTMLVCLILAYNTFFTGLKSYSSLSPDKKLLGFGFTIKVI